MKRPDAKKIIFGLLACSLLPRAQVCDLDECVKLALQNKSDIITAGLTLQSAELGRKGSYSAILPNVSASGGLDQDGTQTAGISVSQTIYDGGVWWNTIRKGKNNVVLNREYRRQTITSVVQSVYAAYYEYLKNRQLLEVANFNLDLAGKQLEQVRGKYSLRTARRTDLLKSEVQFGQAEVDVVNAEVNLETAYDYLLDAMGIVAGGQGPEIADVDSGTFTVPEKATALTKLESRNPSLLAKQALVAAADLSLRIARGGRLPTLSAKVGTNTGNKSGTWSDEWSNSASLSLSVPLFSGFSQSVQAQRAELELKIQEAEYRQQYQDLLVELNGLLANLKKYERVIATDEKVLESAEADLELADEEYRLGTITILELLDAQYSVISARSDLITARFEALSSAMALKALTGELADQYEASLP